MNEFSELLNLPRLRHKQKKNNRMSQLLTSKKNYKSNKNSKKKKSLGQKSVIHESQPNL